MIREKSECRGSGFHLRYIIKLDAPAARQRRGVAAQSLLQPLVQFGRGNTFTVFADHRLHGFKDFGYALAGQGGNETNGYIIEGLELGADPLLIAFQSGRCLFQPNPIC